MSESRAKQLISAGDFRGAAAWVAAKKELSHIDRAHKAHTELEIGDISIAHEQAALVLRERIDNRTRAYVLSLAGRALGRLGSIREGIGLQRKAVALAAGSWPDLESELLADLAAALLNWIGIEPALVELPRLRRISLSSGNTRALIDYHIITARIAAMRGLLRRAEKESDIAANLLETTPNEFQRWKIEQVLSNVAIKACDLSSARSHTLACLALAEAASARFSIGTTLGNLAHIASMAGDVGAGQGFLDRALSSLSGSSQMLVAGYSTGVELGLVANDDSYVEAMIELRAGIDEEDPTQLSYYSLWFELNRARWLIRNNEFVEAATRAIAALGVIEKRADTDLLHQMSLLAAEASGFAGQSAQALKLFESVWSSAASVSLETLVELNRVAATLCLRTDPTSATYQLSRADRILTSAGLWGKRKGVDRTGAVLGLSAAVA